MLMPEKTLESIPLDWVRAFEAAGRLGSFTSAARETGLTQAAISQRIANLEARLGAKLFHRQARGVTLTIEAEAWLPHASEALTLLHQSAQDIFSTRPRSLTICASSTVTQGWLMPRLPRLEGRTRLHLSFVTLMVEADQEPERGRVTVRYGAGDWPGQRAARLFSEELAPLVARGLKSNWSALPRIAVTGPRVGWSEWDSTTTTEMRVDSMSAALAAAEAGAGVVLASLPLSRRLLAEERLQRVGTRSLKPASSYWLTARAQDISQRRWEALVAAFCEV